MPRGQTHEVSKVGRRVSTITLAFLARARDNVPDEYSVAIAHTVQRPASRLYSEARGVDIPEYRRNG